MVTNPIVETYSRLAADYDRECNSGSCWVSASRKALAAVALCDRYRMVADVGCGTGRALATLAASAPPEVKFVGIEPAMNMRMLARQHTEAFPSVEILGGCFEDIPLESHSLDYLFSIFAFHWATDVERSVSETARVLKPDADMDLFFIGRNNGREFIQKTSPIFLKYMGPARFLESVKMRKQFTADEAFALFSKYVDPRRLSVQESYDTYYDTLEGHLGWWVRIEGQFVNIPPAERERCDRDVRNAIASLEEPRGIPYTIHQLHVRVRAR